MSQHFLNKFFFFLISSKFLYGILIFLFNFFVNRSRFETVTNVVKPSAIVASSVSPVGRAIDLNRINVNQIGGNEKSEKKNLNDKSHLNENLLSLNVGKIVDADGISTLFYTTKTIGTYINDAYTQLTEKTSSVTVDETKKKLLSDAQTVQTDSKHKTGLVRLIDGTMVSNHTTTIYQSKVIGTIIDNRYAQIIESTSSYIIDKTQEPNINPSSTIPSHIKATASVISPSSAVIESSLNTESDSVHHGDEETEHEDESEDDEENVDEVDENGRKKSRLSLATKKRTFTPIIRPFASRNRPTFAPKRKNLVASSATIITRSDFTPTITATPVSKAETSSRRFTGGRRSSNAPHANPNSSTSSSSTFASSSKRFSRLRTNSVSGSSASSAVPNGSARIRPTATRSSTNSLHFGSSSRRIGSLFRSNSIPGRSITPTAVIGGRFRSSAHPSISPSLNIPKYPHEQLDDTTTSETDTQNGENTENTDVTGDDESTATTTENARRNQNPLLRFRRPLSSSNRFQPTSAPRTQSPITVTTRKSPLQRSRSTQASTTTSTTTQKPKRTFQKPASLAALTNRPRSSSNNLFPPRGLFKQTTPAVSLDLLEKDENNNVANDTNQSDAQNNDEQDQNNENIDDNEDDEDSVDPEYDNRNRRENKALAFTPQSSLRIRKRTKRQVDYGTRTLSRYRRPAPSPPQISSRSSSLDDTYYDDVDYQTQKPVKTSHTSSRYQSRYRPPTSSNSNTNVVTENYNSNSRIRPTKTNSQKARPQFTLRSGSSDKETPHNSFSPSNSRTSNFRRTQSSSAHLNNAYVPSTSRTRKPLPTSVASRSKTSRLRNYSGTYGDTRNSSPRGRTSTSTNSRGNTRTTARSRNGRINSDAIDYEYIPQNDGTITVTYQIPTEVTIPVVNGKITEYKNVITAKISTEILGPNQYSTTTRGNNLNTVLVLASEATKINNGATEITQFFLKETPTTSITFTPTSIRGRKTSFSHVVPSTVYNVDAVVSTIQPQISANAPLANILLSQLLLGNLGLNPQNQLLGFAQSQQLQPIAQTPTTEFKVRTTTYVTTVTDAKSTIIPITFRGKEILTTIVDSSKFLIGIFFAISLFLFTHNIM